MSNVGDIVMEDNEYKIVTGDGSLATIGGITNTGVVSGTTVSSYGAMASSITIGPSFDMDDFLDEQIMNRIAIDHKVQEQELMKLKEVAPDYASEIKENLAKNAARDIVKKMTFTKKHDKDADVHHFIGRVWVFTEDELKNLINKARNV